MPKKILSIYFIAIILGVLTGILGSLFQISIALLTKYLHYLYLKAAHFGVPQVVAAMFVSTILLLTAWFMVKKIAPEAAGSGVHEIEGAMIGEREVYWYRLIPVKFIAGVLAISAKLVLGREGPTIQMGGNLGKMLGGLFNISKKRSNSLMAAGSAAGLAAAFNAPLAGVLFVLEEMRNEFNFSFTNFKLVAISCVMATITLHYIVGAAPVISMDIYLEPDLSALKLFFIFGLLMGFIGLYFNKILMYALKLVDKLNTKKMFVYIIFIGLSVGFLGQTYPNTVGGGYEIIHNALSLPFNSKVLLLLFVIRFIMTIVCYSSSVPGGIFAPMLALGTLIGLAFAKVVLPFFPDISIHPGMFAIAGMGALFAAAVRAPVTGIVLVVEMTQNYLLILPLMIVCLTSTTVVQLAKNPPIYTQLLRRAKAKQK